MADIFICYRHDDATGFAARLADDLAALYPRSKIFRDIQGLEGGVDFQSVIERNLATCAAFLAVIGPRWLDGAEGTAGSRLHDDDDFVRLEISTALRRGAFVVPILVGGAEMPQAEALPPDVAAIAKLQAHTITDRHWDADVAALARVLGKRPAFRSLRNRVAALLPRRAWKIAVVGSLATIALLVTLTKVATPPEPVLPGFDLIALDLVNSSPSGQCVKPLECTAPSAATASEVLRLGSAEVRVDEASHELHVLLDVRWTLREGPTRWLHRGYTGKIYYVVEYSPARGDTNVVLSDARMRDYSLAPVNGFIAFAFGWVEVRFLVGRDDDLAAQVKERLAAALSDFGPLG